MMNASLDQMWRPLGFSAICHVVLFLVLVFMPDLAPSRSYVPLVINVDLVAMPSQLPKGGGGLPEAAPVKVEKKAAPEKSVPQKVEEKPPARKPEVSIAKKKKTPPRKKPKIKRSLKKKTFKPDKVVAKAIEKIEKKVAKAEVDPLAKTLAKLEKAVEKQEETREKPPVGTGVGPGTPTAGEGRQILEKIDLYHIEIAYRVERNWAYSEQLSSRHNDLMAMVAFRVLPDGRIDDIWFDQRSGDPYFDESVRKAILKSNPVPPFPDGIERPFLKFGLRFTPKGVH